MLQCAICNELLRKEDAGRAPSGSPTHACPNAYEGPYHPTATLVDIGDGPPLSTEQMFVLFLTQVRLENRR